MNISFNLHNVSYTFSYDTSNNVLRDVSNNVLRDVSNDALDNVSDDELHDVLFDILNDVLHEVLPNNTNNVLHDVSNNVLHDVSNGVLTFDDNLLEIISAYYIIIPGLSRNHISDIVTELSINTNYDCNDIIRHMRYQATNNAQILHNINVYENDMRSIGNRNAQFIAEINEDGDVVDAPVNIAIFEEQNLDRVRNAQFEHMMRINENNLNRINHLMENTTIMHQGETYNIVGRVAGEHTLIDNDYKDLTEKIKEQCECTICCEDYEDDDRVIILPCDHIFHNNCIIPWIQNSSTKCPICHAEILRNGVLGENGELRYESEAEDEAEDDNE